MTDPAVQPVIDAVSDGEDIDWAAVRRRYGTGPDTAALVHLETVSKRAHHLTRDPEASAEPRESPAVVMLMAIASLHIAIGALGAALYREWSVVNTLRLLTMLAYAGTSLVLRRSRSNPRARDLGAAFMLGAFSFSRQPYLHLIDAWFADSLSVRLLQTGFALDAWGPFFFWRFARRFPATLRFTTVDRAAQAMERISLIIGAGLFAANLVSSVRGTREGVTWFFSGAFEEGQRFTAVLFVLMLSALPVILMRARTASDDERGRVQLFTLALVLGSLPTFVEVILEALFPAYTAFLRGADGPRTTMIVFALVASLWIPFATTYSVLVHRLMDVRVAVHHNLRHLLARYTLLALALAPSAFLVAHVYTHRDESLVTILGGSRATVLAGLATLGAVLLRLRATLVRRLDGWFRPNVVDPTVVLADVNGVLRLARTRAELAASIAEAADRALDARAFVHFHDPRRRAFVPYGPGGAPLSSGSALAAVLAEDGRVTTVRVSQDRPIWRFLPQAERLWIEQLNAQLAVVVPSEHAADAPAGVIAVGPRRDSFSFTPEHERFVAALASAAGIALENLRLRSGTDSDEDAEFGRLCVACNAVSDDDPTQSVCSCGGELEAAAVPRRIGGKWRVDALLGAGGMGVAYLATDLSLDRRVALKTLPSVSGDAFARLRGEARTMAALSHPNVATILGTETWRGTLILVCEYLPGGTLQQRLARGPLPLQEALALGAALAGALDYMHTQRVMHRDVKPRNIAFSAEGTPKLLDFGIAGFVWEANTERPIASARAVPPVGTTLAGTLPYLPPEALRGAAPSPSFDVWALSVVLFECIVGRHPFAEGRDTLLNIHRGRWTVSAGGGGIPAPVWHLLQRALSIAPGDRFESAAAFREVLLSLSSVSKLEMR